MANPELLKILEEGVKAWNAWRMENLGFRPDLSDAFRGTRLHDGADLRGADLRDTNLFGAHFGGANFNGAHFSHADMRFIYLSSASLNKAQLDRVKLSNARLGMSDFSGANLRSADLSDADLSGANLADADLSNANLRGANLRAAKLNGTLLINAHLVNAHLKGANLSRAWLDSADLDKANLSDADLSGVNLIDANLRGADLSDTDLSDAILSDANLLGTNLSCATLSRANLSYTILSDANLLGAKARLATFSDANLSRANLSGADLSVCRLRGANLSNATLHRANLTKAELGGTVFADVNLSSTIDLEQIHHALPSTIGTDTLYKSKGKIPEVFLRGCGLSDWEIAAAKLHDPNLSSEQVIDLTYEIARIKAESPIQVNPIFLSYSRRDAEFVDTIETQFDKKRIRYWRDTRHATSGPLEDIVDRAMQHGRVVLLILSKESVNSDWVEWEVERAREIAKESKEHVLCPIALDDSWETCDWPDRLRKQVNKYNILDFSEWKNERAMATAFQRLIDGLGIYYPKDVATP